MYDVIMCCFHHLIRKDYDRIRKSFLYYSLSFISDKLLRPVGWDTPTQYAASWPHASRPVLLIVTLLIAQALAAASQPTSYSTAKLRLHAGNFCEKCHFLVTPTRIDIKLSRCPAHGLYAFACKISPLYDTTFRRR